MGAKDKAGIGNVGNVDDRGKDKVDVDSMGDMGTTDKVGMGSMDNMGTEG
eukprot:CAMPEP_0170604610 /NCGR_PEP_ID=MMETSP0224-20130122/19517_1 /TAXON_ID=285029 /ORGANISM="Togula jolla, Strain CCCM 725" /LENGTH=49 /DNA_ID= /DNA_START= /DNA_END= /DNA_ORIENTATION=